MVRSTSVSTSNTVVSTPDVIYTSQQTRCTVVSSHTHSFLATDTSEAYASEEASEVHASEEDNSETVTEHSMESHEHSMDTDDSQQTTDVQVSVSKLDVTGCKSQTDDKTAEWECTLQESAFMDSFTSAVQVTQTAVSSQPSTTATRRKFIYVKTQPRPSSANTSSSQCSHTQSTPKSSKPMQPNQMGILELKVDSLIQKVEQSTSYVSSLLQLGDTETAVDELKSLHDTVKQGKIGIHQSIAKVKQQLHSTVSQNM